MTIQAPYRFVPLAKSVVFPEWADQVSHDKPFADGICGELDITLTTHSRTCVGGEQTRENNQVGKVHFYRTAENKPAIPASSLKGMLRNVLEIATFSRFKQAEDQKLGVRDISEADNFYAQAITRQPTKAGWLSFDYKQGWVIQPCLFVRTHQQSILEYFHLQYSDWSSCKTVMQRYAILQSNEIIPEVTFSSDYHNLNGRTITQLDQAGDKQGYLVVTGQPGQAFNDAPKAKKYEFVFFDTSERKLPIASKVMKGFKQIHDNSKEWEFWQKKQSSLIFGIPVFYHETNGQVRSLGLAMMYKLAYTHSVHDAIGHSALEHIDSDRLDFSDILFGCINNNYALRGRVNLSMATICSDYRLSMQDEVILSQPKPTYYPFYIRQNNTKEFNQLMQRNVELAGWKRYPLKQAELIQPTGKSAENKKIQVKLETISEGSQFKFKLRFHNLRPVELGALLWSLDFGGKTELLHQIGTGKPYGLGQVKLSYDPSKSDLRLNNYQKIGDNALFFLACRQEFIDYMESIFKLGQAKSGWQKSGEIQALLDYAKPNLTSYNLEYMPTPKAYADVRKVSYLSRFIDEFHQYTPSEFENVADFTYQNKLEQQLQLVADIQRANEYKQAREEVKKTASDEERVLLELEDFVAQAEQNPTNKTLKDKAAKLFKAPFERQWLSFDNDQRQRFKALANRTNELFDDKALGKLVKKINAET